MRSTDCEGCFCYAVCDDDLLQADMTLASAGYRLNDFFLSRFTLLHSSFGLGFMHHYTRNSLRNLNRILSFFS